MAAGRARSAVSLFSGAGGLDLGLERAGFEMLTQVDLDHPSVETLRRHAGRFGHADRVIEAPIEELDPRAIMRRLGLKPGQLDLLAGGPPCQPFTTTGRRRALQDGRAGSAFPAWLEWLRVFRPKALVMENVTGLPIYGFDLAHHPRRHALVLWNETDTVNGRFTSVRRTAAVGAAQVQAGAVPQNHIPGVPAYYWLLPRSNFIATVGVEQTRPRPRELAVFFEDFLRRRSSHVREVSDATGTTRYQYRANAGGDPMTVRPKFSMRRVRVGTDVDEIIAASASIRRLHRKRETTWVAGPDRTLLDALLVRLGLVPEPEDEREVVRYDFSVAYTPTSGEVEELIDQYALDGDESLSDLGFALTGEQGIRWLSGMLHSHACTISTEEVEGVVTSGSLFASISNVMRQIRAELRERDRLGE